MSFNPQTGLVYIPTNNVCMDWSVSDVTYKRGVFYLGAEFPTKEGPGGFLGEPVAWDPIANKKVWSIKEDLPFNGGTLNHSRQPGVLRQSSRRFPSHRCEDRHGALEQEPRKRNRCGACDLLGGWQAIRCHCHRTDGPPFRAFLGDIGKKMVAAAPEGGALFVFAWQ